MKIIKFYGNTCGPCRVMKPIFETAKKDYPNFEFEEIEIEDLDDDTEKLVEKYKIQSIPTFVATTDNGKLIDKFSGLKSSKDFNIWISSAAEKE